MTISYVRKCRSSQRSASSISAIHNVPPSVMELRTMKVGLEAATLPIEHASVKGEKHVITANSNTDGGIFGALAIDDTDPVKAELIAAISINKVPDLEKLQTIFNVIREGRILILECSGTHMASRGRATRWKRIAGKEVQRIQSEIEGWELRITGPAQQQDETDPKTEEAKATFFLERSPRTKKIRRAWKLTQQVPQALSTEPPAYLSAKGST